MSKTRRDEATMNGIDRLNTLQEKIENYLGRSILTPHEILLHLGFNVPEEGVKINPYDRSFHIESLKLLGKTIDIEGVPESDLIALRNKMHLEVAETQGKDTIPEVKERSVEKLRAFIEATIRCVYRLEK